MSNKRKLISQMTKEEKEEFLYNDIDGFLAQSEAEMTANIEARALNRDFWSQFYGHYPHLKEDDGIVRAVLQREFARLKDTPARAAMNEVADIVEREKKAMMKRWADQREASVMVHDPDGRAPSPNVSLSALIKRRKEERRSAEGGFRTGGV